ncbi:MAG: hypothetical protein RL518_911 [Pseudomonadota bacterium]
MSDRLSHVNPTPSPGPHSLPEPLLVPPLTLLPRNLSNQLRDVAPGGMVFVDGLGETHHTKERILERKLPPLVSFRKQPDGSFRVYSGLPPRNLTHCGSGSVPHPENLERDRGMQCPVILNSGDWIALTAALPVAIPTFLPTDPVSPADKIASKIAAGLVGETLILGRSAVPECPTSVSRAHITIKILERSELSPTRIQLRVLAIPGIEGSHPIYEVKPDGQLEQITGSKLIPAGGTIQVGERGERLTLPHPKNSLDEASRIFHHSLLRNDPEANQSVVSVFGLQGLKKVQFDALREYVITAVTMIREGRSGDAIVHLLTQSKELDACGYTLSAGAPCHLASLNRESIANNLSEVAYCSWFQNPAKRICVSYGILSPGLTPTNDEERELLAVWERNVALIVAEEYVHALQDMHGGAISDYTPILGGKARVDLEADVALFYKRHGIDLSDGLFLQRHGGVREHAIECVEGRQSKDSEERFKRSLLEAPLKTPVPIVNEVSIARTEEGYTVTPIGDLSGRYFMTAHGPAKELLKAVTLQGGDQIFLGGNTFTLPRVTEDS